MIAKLNLRVLQLHEAMEQTRVRDISEVPRITEIADDTSYVRINFSDGISEARLANIVSMCIANIACLKDHLKAWCKENNKAFVGEELISSNRSVGLMHDLWNRDKHYQLEKSRTGLFPEIRNIRRNLRLSTEGSTGSRIAIAINPQTGQLEKHGDGTAELTIDAEIVDKDGNFVCNFLEAAKESVNEWEGALASVGVIAARR